nr:transposase [Streptomyces sp. OM5714]
MSDRQATKAVHRHTDFHYALATELDNPGFHHSVLTNFRTRPADDNHADHLLDPARRHASRKPGRYTNAPARSQLAFQAEVPPRCGER